MQYLLSYSLINTWFLLSKSEQKCAKFPKWLKSKASFRKEDVTNSLVTNETKMARVTNGKDVPHPIPWQIQISSKLGGSCGGTIINSQSILTAAHCFDDDGLKNIASDIFYTSWHYQCKISKQQAKNICEGNYYPSQV